MPFCENCGNNVSETSKFCVKCGSQLEPNEAKAIINSDSMNESAITNPNEANQPVVETEPLSDNNTKVNGLDSGKVNFIKKRKPFYNSTWFWLLLLVTYYMVSTGNTVLLIPVIIIAGIYFFYHGILKKDSWWGK
jgi:uncharacterized membrane protein YvbJ